MPPYSYGPGWQNVFCDDVYVEEDEAEDVDDDDDDNGGMHSPDIICDVDAAAAVSARSEINNN